MQAIVTVGALLVGSCFGFFYNLFLTKDAHAYLSYMRELNRLERHREHLIETGRQLALRECPTRVSARNPMLPPPLPSKRHAS